MTFRANCAFFLEFSAIPGCNLRIPAFNRALSSPSVVGPTEIRMGFLIERNAHMADRVKPLTKMQIYNNLAEATGLNKKQVSALFDALKIEVGKAISKKGAGQFTIPDLCKIVCVQKKALPKRQVRNPATGEMIWADPKPASTTVKVRALKKLKDMV
jgi:nucleoid DNA-binding protein